MNINKTILCVFTVLFLIASCKDKQPGYKDSAGRNDTVSEIKSHTEVESLTGKSHGLKDIKFNISELPEGIKYNGTIRSSASWRDKNGINYVMLTETEEKIQNGESRMKELYAYHWIYNDNKPTLLWKTYDFIKECPFDIFLEHIGGSLSVTDLNSNGIAETIFLYKLSCRSDVSPDDLKLIMHEGEKKYAIRGTMQLEYNGESSGGQTNIDKSFNNAPKIFLDYARDKWQKFRSEKIN